MTNAVPSNRAVAGSGTSFDRVLTQDNQKQIYGSQFQTNEDGKTFLLPVEDFEQIDERRASMGLESFDEYRKNFEK